MSNMKETVNKSISRREWYVIILSAVGGAVFGAGLGFDLNTWILVPVWAVCGVGAGAFNSLWWRIKGKVS
jgi:hypothetical protein